MYLKLVLLVLPLLAAAEPLPAIRQRDLDGRDQCNADNCLRALRRYTATDFCSTYTTATHTATTGLPTYVTACTNQPSRVSSACTCLNTAPPTPCPIDAPTQVVQDPGFEIPTPTAGLNEGPWTVTAVKSPSYAIGPFPQYDISGSLAHTGLGSFFFYGYEYDGNIGRGVGLGGVVTITQTLTYCPSTKYTFSAYVGYWDDYDPALFGTTVTVYLDGAIIVPTQLACSSPSQCSVPGAQNVFKIGYRDLTAEITTSATTTGELKLVFELGSTAPGNPAFYATLLDDITLTRVI